MADAYNAVQAKHLSQLSTDLSNIPVKDPRVRSHLFCLGGFSKGSTEQEMLEEGVGGRMGVCWAGMRRVHQRHPMRRRPPTLCWFGCHAVCNDYGVGLTSLTTLHFI